MYVYMYTHIYVHITWIVSAAAAANAAALVAGLRNDRGCLGFTPVRFLRFPCDRVFEYDGRRI